LRLRKPGTSAPDIDVADVLEPTQRSATKHQRLPRQALDRKTSMILLVMRIYVIIAVPIVIVAFVRALHPA